MPFPIGKESKAVLEGASGSARGAQRRREGAWGPIRSRIPRPGFKSQFFSRQSGEHQTRIHCPYRTGLVPDSRNSTIVESYSEQLDQPGQVEFPHRITGKMADAGLCWRSKIDAPGSWANRSSHALAFGTQTVRLDVDRTPYKNHPSAMAVRDRDRQDVGRINVTAEWRESRPDRLPLILVAWNLRWVEPFLDVMCVEWVRGNPFRVQVFRDAVITDRAWATSSLE